MNRVREHYDQLAGTYDRRWAEYIRASTRHTLARANIAPGEMVLDVGCGTGALRRVSGIDMIGVDLSPAMLAHATGARAAADVAALPFSDDTFDVVVTVSSLHYWPEPERALAEMRRVIKPTGRLVLTDWCDDYLACRICDRVLRIVGRSYVRAYGLREIGPIFEHAGLRAISIEKYKIGWLWGLMTAVATA
jgi:ubiquinone/menaquinone biosynthesis C-methylase UbiE